MGIGIPFHYWPGVGEAWGDGQVGSGLPNFHRPKVSELA